MRGVKCLMGVIGMKLQKRNLNARMGWDWDLKIPPMEINGTL